MHKRYRDHEIEKQEWSPGFVNDHTPHHKKAAIFSNARPKLFISCPFLGSRKCATAITTVTLMHAHTNTLRRKSEIRLKKCVIRSFCTFAVLPASLQDFWGRPHVPEPLGLAQEIKLQLKSCVSPRNQLLLNGLGQPNPSFTATWGESLWDRIKVPTFGFSPPSPWWH